MNSITEPYAEQSAAELLMDMPLSAEAKAIAAQVFRLGFAPTVTTQFSLEGNPDQNFDVLLLVVRAAWGSLAARSVALLDCSDTTVEDCLRAVQELVQSGEYLIAVARTTSGSESHYVLSVNHVLADEASLVSLVSMLETSCRHGFRAGLRRMRAARRAYLSYIVDQKVQDGKPADGYVVDLAPLKLSHASDFAWKTGLPRVTLKFVLEGAAPRVEAIRKAWLDFLNEVNVKHEGNVVCSSRNWRGAAHRDAIGMATGMVPVLSPEMVEPVYTLSHALEARRRGDSVAQHLMRCCLESDVFLNGAEPRGIEASDVRNPGFPVGIELRRVKARDLSIEVEGRFCRPQEVSRRLEQFAQQINEGRTHRVSIQ